jgi:uncharacterized protein YqeY
MTKQQLKDELKNSMLAKDTEKTSVLRMVLSSLKNFEMKKDEEEYENKLKEAGGDSNNVNIDEASSNYEASEKDIETVLQKEAKQRRDSIEQFKAGGRDELAAKENNELKLIESYLPAQMSEEDVQKLVDEAVAQTNAANPADMGKVMGALMPKVKGKADGLLVSRLVREKLAS